MGGNEKENPSHASIEIRYLNRDINDIKHGIAKLDTKMENLVTRKEFETLADRVAALELSKLDVKDFEKEFGPIRDIKNKIFRLVLSLIIIAVVSVALASGQLVKNVVGMTGSIQPEFISYIDNDVYKRLNG